MATESAIRSDPQEVKWSIGDRCLAPHPREKRLCEATVQRLAVTEDGQPGALVRFACHYDEDNDDEEEDGIFPLSELRKAASSLYEKPLFHNNQSLPGASVPYALSRDDASIPYTINRYLRDYQREGAKFIYDSYAHGRGCVLGDDMGLGKTIQVIAFLAAALHKTGTWQDVENNAPHFLLSQVSSEKRKTQKVFLVVAPLSVLYNWKDELDTWGHFRSLIVHGARKDEEFARLRRARCEVALTTYETLRLCLDQFNSISWSAVIVDEAHKIKNPNSQITQAMKGMRCKVRVGLTGTILQNNLEELWCVMDWAVPGCLGSLGHFKNRFADPIERGQKHSTTKRNLAMGRRAVELLARRLSRWFLRRTKALISGQLPRKDDRVVYCSMTEFQEAVYRAVLDSEDVTLLLRSGEKCSCSSGRPRKKCCFKNNSKGVPVRFLYFSYLAILRKLSNHVALLQPKGGTSKKQEQYVNDICEKVFQKFPDFMQRQREAAFEAMSDPVYSGKMKVLQKLLKHFMQNKDKMLLFSLSTRLLDILESHCMAEGVEFRRLDGNTKAKERVKIVREFNSSPDINLCLVSTMAGGLGLNFVGANIVVLFDPTWNPANDLQAIDRAYRIGQCRDVTVFRLISLGSVEEVIYLRQVYKQQLQSSVLGKEHARRYFEAVQGSDGHRGELFGIRNLFRLQTRGTCLTRQILETHEERTSGSGPSEPGVGGEAGQGAESGVGPGAGKAVGILDFSSASEGEDGDEEGRGGAGRRKRRGEEQGSAPSGPARLSLFQHGFSKLLQGGGAGLGRGRGDDSDSQEESGGQNDDPPVGRPARDSRQRQDWIVSSDSDGDGVGGGAGCDQRGRPDTRGTPPSSSSAGRGRRKDWRHRGDASPSDGSAGPPPNRAGGSEQPARSSAHVRFRESPDIQGFTSSEDDLPAKMPRPSRDFTALKSRCRPGPPPSPRRRPAEEAASGTIDRLLGGVREVAYLHSNQRVVGSSKAEDQISRAALRHVFQHRKYSQVAANQLLDSMEVLSGQTQPLSPPEQIGAGGRREGGGDGQHVEHPVTHSLRAIRHTQNTTVIMGETPSAICRKQLEEMACFFEAASVTDFARDVLRSASARRQARLRQFYRGRNPELGEFLDQMLPEPATPQREPAGSAPGPSSSSSSSSSARERRPGSGRFRRPTAFDLNAEDPVPDPHPPEPSAEGGVGGGGPGFVSQGPPPQKDLPVPRSETPITRPVPEPAPGPSAQLGQRIDRGASSESWGTHRGTRDTPKPEDQGRGPEREKHLLLTELIGDTSVLDDLFRPRPRAPVTTATAAATTSAATDPPQAPALAPAPAPRKTSRKDFWDILNDGDEESLNQLADPSRAEKICRQAGVAATTKPKSAAANDGAQLWKKNEKFLWKR
ncbi:DNA excision repair protein ERCC-6-like 2 isoform X2 [Anguilla rostrata]|uniref:DNA excision repair protein ERCC-6-like 2 isoform X2 n=1 Tax=Anguilla rostrata TaxID=7938 RepID=UPI0030CC501C